MGDQVPEAVIQGGAAEGVDERKLWKDRLRKEILDELKEKFNSFMDSISSDQLLSTGKESSDPAILDADIKADSGTKEGVVPDDVIKGYSSMGLSLDDSITEDVSSLDAGITDIKSDLEPGLRSGDSGKKGESTEHPPIPEKEAKKRPSEKKQHPRPCKKQNTGLPWSCPLCGVTATCEANLNTHFMGKKHRSNSIKAQKSAKLDSERAFMGTEKRTGGSPVSIQVNGKIIEVSGNGSLFMCNSEVCNFKCTTLSQMTMHLTETNLPHKEVPQKGEEDKGGS